MRITEMVNGMKFNKLEVEFLWTPEKGNESAVINIGSYSLKMERLDKLIEALSEYRRERKKRDAIKARQDAEITAKAAK